MEFSIRLITVYSPNKDTPEVFDNLNRLLDRNTQYYLFLCGDFILLINPSYDYVRSRNLSLNMIDSVNLVDAF